MVYQLRAYTYFEDGTRYWGARIINETGETLGELYDVDEEGIREQLAENFLQFNMKPEDFDILSRDEVELILEEYREKYGR